MSRELGHGELHVCHRFEYATSDNAARRHEELQEISDVVYENARRQPAPHLEIVSHAGHVFHTRRLRLQHCLQDLVPIRPTVSLELSGILVSQS